MPAITLPSAGNSFVGRAEELGQIPSLLADPKCRLLTLVGPGGIGKTRLAIEAARRLPFAAVHFVALQPLNSADFLVSALADATGLQFYPGSDPQRQLLDYLRDKHWLLVLDNFEHLLAGVTLLTDILQDAPDVKLLVTSRERLNVQAEWVLFIDGLPTPDDHADTAIESYSAVQLFIQRARQIQMNFPLEENAEAIRTICQHVEGMPLGLELAASWLRAMSCAQIAAQMARSVGFLTTPMRDVPERHRSLSAVFEQSWLLLTEAERTVLARLSVFRGGFDVEGAEQVTGATLALLAGLVDKSLIRLNANGRYDLHELLRQYAAEKLTAEEIAITADRHLDYFLKLAELAGEAWGREEQIWYERLDADLDNLRAALAWTIQNEAAEPGLRLAAALKWYWECRGHRIEALEWLERLLAFAEDAAPSVQAKALQSAGDIASTLSLEERANNFFDQALTLARQVNDRSNLAWILASHAQFSTRNDLDQAAAMLEESLFLFREIHDRSAGITWALKGRASVAMRQGDYPYAHRLSKQSLTVAREGGDKRDTAWALGYLGFVSWLQGLDSRQSEQQYQEALSLFQEARDIVAVGVIQSCFALLEQTAGNYARAQAHYQAALAAYLETTTHRQAWAFESLAGLGSIARALGQDVRAVRLLAAAESGPRLDFLQHRGEIYKKDLAFIRAQLGEAAFIEAWEAGKAMTVEQAIAYALQSEPPLAANTSTTPLTTVSQALTEPLSERELEVLRLIAEGLSNPEIAPRLYLSVATVKVHTRNIYGKLGVNNRTQAVTQAQKLKLI